MSLLQDHSHFVDRCLTVYGTGHFLLAGDSASKYVTIFRQCNVHVSCLEDGHVTLEKLQGALASSHTNPHTVVVMLHALDDTDHEEIERIIRKLYESGPPYICLVTDITKQTNGHIRDTAWWQSRFFSTGFRQHPRSFHVLDYANREYPSSFAILCFEKIPEKVLEAYPLEYLEKERILHMDMLREPGRRSDAHLVRYVMAAPYIRPGDTVLDCACGLGYGAHILYQNSRAHRIFGIDFSESAIAYATHNYSTPGIIEFFAGDAQNLSQLADNSIDFITSFETIEHLPEPARYLSELARILRPSGRVMFSAPDMWVDETGKDPNPHHFHVYTWEKLYTEVTEHFLPDKGFIQIAGGALRLPNGRRHWEEVPCQPLMEKEAEWVLLLAMKNPLSGKDVPYVETTFPESDNPDYHVGAFKKDYLNPWLLKGMVAIGYRLQNRTELKKLQQTVLENYPPDSTDYGAALCGMGYQLLDASPTQEQIEIFLIDMEYYVSQKNSNPPVMRWKVSLLFVAALLQRSLGNFAEAEALFLHCADYDVAPYSALLGNKTLEALSSAAILALGKKDVKLAKHCLLQALTEAQRLMQQDSWLNVIHSVQSPFEPSFVECAQLMSLASRCCYMLGELDTTFIRPGLAFSVGKDWHKTELNYYLHMISSYKNEIQKHQRENSQLQREALYGKHFLKIFPDGSFRNACARVIWKLLITNKK